MSPPPKLSRRTLALGGIGVAAAAAVAGAIYEVPRLLKHRAQGEYADLVNLLDDPDRAAVVGRAVQADNIHDMASGVRARLKTHALGDLLAEDTAHGALVEANGWVLPAALGALCAMAAA